MVLNNYPVPTSTNRLAAKLIAKATDRADFKCVLPDSGGRTESKSKVHVLSSYAKIFH